jgi:hypothetical protein
MTPLDCVAQAAEEIAPVPLPPRKPLTGKPAATGLAPPHYSYTRRHTRLRHTRLASLCHVVPARAAGSPLTTTRLLNSFHQSSFHVSVSRILGFISVLLCSYFSSGLRLFALRIGLGTSSSSPPPPSPPGGYPPPSPGSVSASKGQGIGFVIANPVASHRIRIVSQPISSRRVAALRILGAQHLDWCAGTVASGRSGRLLRTRHGVTGVGKRAEGFVWLVSFSQSLVQAVSDQDQDQDQDQVHE